MALQPRNVRNDVPRCDCVSDRCPEAGEGPAQRELDERVGVGVDDVCHVLCFSFGGDLMAIRTKDDGGDDREWVRQAMHPLGQVCFATRRQALNEERTALRYRLHEIEKELDAIDAAQRYNERP